MTLSPSQLDARAAGISATDVGAILGVSPYKSAVTVWQERRGEIPPSPDTERSRRGEQLEPLIREDYAARHNVHVERRGTLSHPERPWMLATPDGLAYAGGGAEPTNGLEIKTHTVRLRHLYGAPGTDEVPLYELCQCAWGMAVTGLPRWDLVACIDLQDIEYVIDRDDELIGGMIEKAERFLVDNVRGGVPPGPDGSEAYSEWLKARWGKNRSELLDISDDPETWALIDRARDIKALLELKGDELEKIVQTLKIKVGDAGGLTWKDAHGRPQKITWTRNKPSKRVDHAQMAQDAWQGAALVASGHKAEVSRAVAALQSANRKADADLLQKLWDALYEIGTRSEKGYTTSVPGNRPWTWPRSWSTKIAKEEP